MKHIKIFSLLFLFVLLNPAIQVKACTDDDNCLTQCPIGAGLGITKRPWCSATENGTVAISTNVSSSWTVTGPTTISGSGTSQTSLLAPVGAYTITYATVPGYTTPPSQSLTLANQGDTISFTGTYIASPTVNINFSLLEKLTLFFVSL